MSTATAVLADDDLDDHYLIPAEKASLCIPASASTLDGFLDWINSDRFPEKLHIAWHEGDILIDMSPEEINAHNRVKAGIYRTLDQFVEDNELGLFCLDGVTFVNKGAKVSSEPDAQLVLGKTLASNKAWVRYNKKGKPTAIEGSPDLLIEVVSESSVDKDTRRWRKAYHRAGVREYWIIDAQGPAIEIEILKWSKRAYVQVAVKEGCWESPVLGRRCCLSRKKGRYGFWNYRFTISEE